MYLHSQWLLLARNKEPLLVGLRSLNDLLLLIVIRIVIIDVSAHWLISALTEHHIIFLITVVIGSGHNILLVEEGGVETHVQGIL
jgi:hypothetical protein